MILQSILFKGVCFTRKFSTMANTLKELYSSRCFEGYQKSFSHQSKELNCEMNFCIYLPPQALHSKVPVLYFLNGITANHEYFMVNAGPQRFASKYGLCMVSPDTSPRNVDIPGQDEDFIGYTAGFYLDATQPPWNKHYRMYSYVMKELIEIVENCFPVIPEKKSISGFSMGGHGALICALKNPGMFRSLSSFAGLSNPTKSPAVQQKAYRAYLGPNKEDWMQWDATHLVSQYNGPHLEIFLDCGTADPYNDEGHLRQECFLESAAKNDRVNAYIKWRDGYNHSRYYVSTYIEEHIEYHMKALKETP